MIGLTDDTARAFGSDNAPVSWAVSQGLVDYEAAVSFMEKRTALIIEDRAPELIWLLEHPPLYTAGTSARTQDLLSPDRFPVYQSGRGGQYTYHGPGQRVVYVMLDLRRRGRDVRAFVHKLENWVISTLAELNVTGVVRADRIGVWVARPALGPHREDKIAAIGVRIRRWIAFHGLSINVAPQLEHFDGIVPCGIQGDREHGVTSLLDLGAAHEMATVDDVLKAQFAKAFGAAQFVDEAAPTD